VSGVSELIQRGFQSCLKRRRGSDLYSCISQYVWVVVRLTLPVAHQQASRASSTTMLFPFALSSSLRNRAADVPVMPVPTITISASDGSSSVVRWPSKNLFGSLCQNEFEDVGVGSVARACFIVSDSGYRGNVEVAESLRRDVKAI
jgi:hypothetical protein